MISMSSTASGNSASLLPAHVFRQELCFHLTYHIALAGEIWLQIALSSVKTPVLLCLNLAGVTPVKKCRKYFKVKL